MKNAPMPTQTVPAHMVVIRLGALGDAALVTGVLERWHTELGTRFSVITRSGFAPLFEGLESVETVIPLTPEQLRGTGQIRLFGELARRFQGQPLADLHGNLRTRLLSLLWRGPVWRYPKMGLTRRIFLLSGGKVGGSALLTCNVPQRYAAALAPLCPACLDWTAEELVPVLRVDEESDRWAAHILQSFCSAVRASSPERPVIALHPFATHAAKAWPVGYWQELARQLSQNGVPHMWIGQGGDFVPPQNPLSLNLVNSTSLRQLMALLARVGLLISGDSGPVHLATGVKTSVLALFGPTGREWGFFPSGVKDTVLQIPLDCRPCSLHGKRRKDCERTCMKALTPEKVLEAVFTLCPPGT